MAAASERPASRMGPGSKLPKTTQAFVLGKVCGGGSSVVAGSAVSFRAGELQGRKPEFPFLFIFLFFGLEIGHG